MPLSYLLLRDYWRPYVNCPLADITTKKKNILHVIVYESTGFRRCLEVGRPNWE